MVAYLFWLFTVGYAPVPVSLGVDGLWLITDLVRFILFTPEFCVFGRWLLLLECFNMVCCLICCLVCNLTFYCLYFLWFSDSLCLWFCGNSCFYWMFIVCLPGGLIWGCFCGASFWVFWGCYFLGMILDCFVVCFDVATVWVCWLGIISLICCVC